MQYIFAAALGAGTKYGKNAAHIGYELNTDGRLMQRGIPDDLTGGLMVLTCNCKPLASPRDTAASIAKEIAQRKYRGIIADFECPHDRSYEIMLRELKRLTDTKIYTEPLYAPLNQDSAVLVSTNVRGGSYDLMLTRASSDYGSRAVLQVQRLCEDSILPYSAQSSKPLEPSQRKELLRTSGAQCFFSSKLLTNYFTYYDAQKKAHFVLYDTAATIRRKLELASRRGFKEALITPQEFEDIWAEMW